MIICHLCLNGPYTEGLNYQENILPKYHAKAGNKVYQVVTPFEWNQDQIVMSSDTRYINQYGVEIIRCTAKKRIILKNRFNRYLGLKELLEEINPDILFIHDVQFMDADVVAKFLKKHPNCIAYADNHCDYLNSAKNWISKRILHGVIWKHKAHQLEPYIKKFYGVLPARVDILVDLYKLPREKCELLVMGADDELIERVEEEKYREQLIKEKIISERDFLIVTGGKINANRPEVLNLMEAVANIENKNVKLVIFGSVSQDFQKQFNHQVKSDKVVFVGWKNALDTYRIMSAADLIVFPGLHSVMWEQAVALGVPCVFRKLDGFHHIDLGGNAKLVDDVSANSLKEIIENIINDKDSFSQMKKNAREKGPIYFSYRNIAMRSIENSIKE